MIKNFKKACFLMILILLIPLLFSCSALNNLFNPAPAERKPLRGVPYNPNGELFFQEEQMELFKDGVSLGVTDNTDIAQCVQYILGKYQ